MPDPITAVGVSAVDVAYLGKDSVKRLLSPTVAHAVGTPHRRPRRVSAGRITECWSMNRLSIAALAILVLIPTARADESAGDLLSKMARTHASMKSYTDRGVVRLYLIPNSSPNETTFETAFERPARFRFAWVMHHPFPPLRHIAWPAVVWSDGADSYSRYDYGLGPPVTEKVESLGMAIAGATGVSNGAAHTVPRLLMPEIGGTSVADLKSGTVVGIESVEGEPCYHVVGEARIGQTDVWIGTKDSLIRKVQERLSSTLQEEIRRDIHVGEEIPQSKFAS